jgi:pimeloyl-ACP methyl ester carboxylesterase
MEKVTSADGTTIAFDQSGGGPPLVLVAGASCDRHADDGIAAALAGDFTVLNYDRRGRGDSSDAASYAVDRELEDLAAMLEAAGGTGVLVGLSSGAALAALAAGSGLPVTHLVMWEPPYRLDTAGREASIAYADRLDELLAAGRRADALEHFLRTVGVPAPVISGMRSSPHWAQGEAIAPTLAYDARVLGDAAPPTDRLAAVRARALVLAGADSPSWMRAGAQAAADAIPGARCQVLGGQTHAVEPAVLASAVRDFVGGSS